MPRKDGLTKKEKAFCEAYVYEGLSATGAYLKAYDCEYSTANSAGWKMLQKPHIKEYITTIQKEAFEAACISAEKIALQLAEIAFVENGNERFASQAQLKALDLLQKQLGLQKQKVEADVTTDVVINITE
jgi:phage terminase small subunit